jgi:hydroxyethylthiazole kinase-like uncharacterized protein yjeF
MNQLLDKLERVKDSHKGENGKVGVIAGSKDYTGAPALASKAAMRTGCDLTHILTSEKVGQTVAGYSENFIVSEYASNYFTAESLEKAKEIEEWSNSVLIGPGMSEPETEAIQVLISYTEKPCVVDADAIEPALEAEITEAVFTPHKGEAEHIKEKYGSIERFVEQEDAVVVLKGQEDRIYNDKGVDKLKVGSSSMTVGGTGDTLAGIIASLIAQGLEKEDAAKLGTWINGKAGEKASGKLGNGMLATDLIEKIPGIIQS